MTAEDRAGRRIQFEPDIREAVEKFGGTFPPRKIPSHLWRPVPGLPQYVHAPDVSEAEHRDDQVARFVEDVDAVKPGGAIRIFTGEAEPEVYNNPLIIEAVVRATRSAEAMRQHYNRGTAMVQEKRYGDALYDYEYVERVARKLGFTPESVAELPNEAARGLLQDFLGNVFSNYGFTLLRLNRFEEAIPKLQRALRFNPAQMFANNNLGDCHGFLEHFDDAKEYYRRELAINPSHPTAQQSLDRLGK